MPLPGLAPAIVPTTFAVDRIMEPATRKSLATSFNAKTCGAHATPRQFREYAARGSCPRPDFAAL